MIGYLKGQTVEIIKGLNNRIVLIVEINYVGYEVQIPSRFARQVSIDTEIQVFVHLQVREEVPILYGFATAAERDLFRQLVGVSGIGAQLAIALVDTLGIETLVQAIVTGNIRTLSKTPGVGKKTAERIALELKTKLSQWRQLSGVRTSDKAAPAMAAFEDVEMTLLALGYENQEIEQALSALSKDDLLLKNTSPEEWIRRAIEWLSQ
ncbi:MAG: Holliday junction branch migration protein RuvA [Cyanobacteriota bacterium]|nr:Holliday junction branch migration protein RuvA [Cyanobacteriota bacterium]